MSFFNETIVTKKLRNIIDTFFRKCQKMNTGFIYLDTLFVPQILKQYAKGIIAKYFLQFKTISLQKDRKNLVLLLLKSKFE